MSVYTEHFSKRDAYKRYNLNKIQYDVFNYDLKNKLIFDDFHTFDYSNCIHTKSYNAEEYIIRKIQSKKSPLEIVKILPCLPGVSDTELESFCEDQYKHELNGKTELLCKNNDLYLNMELLVLATAYDDVVNTMLSSTTKNSNSVLAPVQKEGIIEFLDGSETLNAILQLECALSRKESLVTNLGWLLTEYRDKYTLSEFDDLENIKNEYKSGKIPYLFNYSLTNNYMPIHIVNPCHHKHDATFIASSFLGNKEYLNLNTSTRDGLISIQFRKVLIYGIEILNAIETIKNEKLRNILYNLFIKDLETHPGKCLFIKDYLYKKNDVSGELEINKKVKDIIDIKDMSERFKAILEYSKTVTYPSYTTFEGGFEYVPMFLSFFVQYCNDVSFKSIRIKIALFLLEEMKALGIVLDSRNSEKLFKGFASMGVNMDNTSNDLFKTSYTEHSETEPVKDENPSKTYSEKVKKMASVNEILDRKVSEFTESMYTFNTKIADNSLEDEPAKDMYNNILKSVNLVSKNLTKQIKDIKTYNEGGKNGNLSKGKLDKKNIHRYKYDKNIFYNNTYKIKESDLAFGILLDISGSMHGVGIENGRITMIILHEVLKTLGINHCIATHNSRNQHQCNITKYVQFKENANHSIGKCYDLATISASGGNCDSGALYYMEKELLRTTNKDKICLIFSDGEPTECTGTELRDQVKHMEKEGIKVIGIGINFDSIKDYYLDYANGRTLKEMLNIVAGILKQYVLDKKD